MVVVREISDEDMDRFVERFEGPDDRSGSFVDGCYQGDLDSQDQAGRITLRQSLSGDAAALVFVHEYGHYVWENLLTAGDRGHYKRIWREQKRARRLITEYAEESDEEGFAEAFAYYIRRPASLRRMDSRSWRFLAAIQEVDGGEARGRSN